MAQLTVDGADAGEVFRLIVHQARNLIGAASSTIGTVGADSTGLTIRAADGARAKLLQVGATVPIEMTLAAEVVRTGRSLVVPGPEFALEPIRAILLRFGLGPAMCVPLVARGRVFGAMTIADLPASPPFRAAHLALIKAFAGQAVIALEFARLRDELRRLAVVDERERIARELHDGAIQGLFGIGLELQAMATRHEVAATSARLDAAVGRIDAVITELRRYIAALRPGILNSLSQQVAEDPGLSTRPSSGEVTAPPKPVVPSSPARTGGRASGKRAVEYRLRVVGEINQAILDGVDVDTVFGRLAHSARTLAKADSAIAGTLRGEDLDALVLRAIEGPHTEGLRPGDLFQVEDTVLAKAVRTGRASVVADVERAGGFFLRSKQLGIGAAVAVPLAVRGQVFGALAVGWSRRRPAFPPADVRLMATFAAQAAIGLEYGRARDEHHRLAVLEERERIARELHESVIQTLFGAGMDLQALATTLDDPTTTRRLGNAVEGIDSVIRDLRNYVFGLRPGILADRHVDRALRELAGDFAQRTGIAATVEIEVQVAARLAGAAATDVVQIAREALSNIARHAHASDCRVALRSESGSAVLEVADDGRGTDPELIHTSGQGLSNMRARAAALGGVLIIAVGLHGRGTAVRAIVPL